MFFFFLYLFYSPCLIGKEKIKHDLYYCIAGNFCGCRALIIKLYYNDNRTQTEKAKNVVTSLLLVPTNPVRLRDHGINSNDNYKRLVKIACLRHL